MSWSPALKIVDGALLANDCAAELVNVAQPDCMMGKAATTSMIFLARRSCLTVMMQCPLDDAWEEARITEHEADQVGIGKSAEECSGD